MSIIHLEKINRDIMRRVDFEENELYLTVCGQYVVFPVEEEARKKRKTNQKFSMV